MSISPNVVIMTRDELDKRVDQAFRRGVERGRFDAVIAKVVAQARQKEPT